MIAVGLFGGFDGFALFGNAVCLVGNVLWAYFIVSYDMNDTTAGIFMVLAAVNAVALGSQVRKCCRAEHKGDESDSEGEGEGGGEDSGEGRAGEGGGGRGTRSGTAASMARARKKRQRIHAD